MSSLQTYERGALFLDGQLLVECQSITAEFDSKNVEINTQQKGLAGMSPGSEVTKLTIEEAFPRAGVDFDAISSMQALDVLEVVLFAGSKKYKTKGYITKVNHKFGTDSAASQAFDMTCGPVEQSAL